MSFVIRSEQRTPLKPSLRFLWSVFKAWLLRKNFVEHDGVVVEWRKII